VGWRKLGAMRMSPQEAMRSPAFYPDRPDNVEVVETHISWVFLAGDRAYKLRKPVVFPFLDYGTAERRDRCLRQRLEPRRPHLAADVVEPVEHEPRVDVGGHLGRLVDGVLDLELDRRRRGRAAQVRQRLGQRGAAGLLAAGAGVRLLFISPPSGSWSDGLLLIEPGSRTDHRAPHIVRA
jgi:hypothetical protein